MSAFADAVAAAKEAARMPIIDPKTGKAKAPRKAAGKSESGPPPDNIDTDEPKATEAAGSASGSKAAKPKT